MKRQQPPPEPDTYVIRLVMRIPARPGQPIYLRPGERPARIEVEPGPLAPDKPEGT